MGWGIAMMVVMVLFWVIVIVAAVLLIRHLVRARDRSDPSDAASPTALQVLDGRFAQGEIESDEYRERRSILERDG